jgi:hypothetical protein
MITTSAPLNGVLDSFSARTCRRSSKSGLTEKTHDDRQHDEMLRSSGPAAQGWVTQAWRWVQLRQLCVALFLLVSVVSASAQELTTNAKSEPTMRAIRPFKLHIPDIILADLNRRLASTKWPDQLPGTSWEYGADIKKVRELADYWQRQFNWRAQESRINQYNQFTTEIDGQLIYFIHQRSRRPGANSLRA